MPLNSNNIMDIYDETPLYDASSGLAKKFVYGVALGTASTYWLGGETNWMEALNTGAIMSAGSLGGVVVGDYVANNLVKDTTMLGSTEKMLIEAAGSMGGGMLSLYKFKDIPLSFNSALLSGVTYTGTKVLSSYDQMLLGRLF